MKNDNFDTIKNFYLTQIHPVFLVKSFALLFLFSVLFARPLMAQVYTFFENRAITPTSPRAYPHTRTRQIIPLVGQWKVILPSGLESHVEVPCAFHFSNKVTFEKSVFLPQDFETRVLTLVSEGMGQYCEIFFNDQFVGAHTTAAPFSMDIPSEMLLIGAENKLSIVCNSRLDAPNSFPLAPQAHDKRHFSGLFRNLYLVASSPIRFNDIDFDYQVFDTLIAPASRTPAPRAEVQPCVRLNLEVSIKQFDLRGVRLPTDSLGQKTLFASAQLFLDTLAVSDRLALARFEAENNYVLRTRTSLLLLNAKLWQPDSPTRYRLHLLLTSARGDTLDDLSFSLGFRTVGFASGKFQLNRKPFLLKGLHISEETEQSANVLSPDDILRDLLLARSAGVNALRFTEIPHPLWYRFSDSLGFLVFLELPARNVPTSLLVKPSFSQHAESALQETLALSKFSPSVIGYGLGEGLDLEDERTEIYLQHLSSLIKTHTSSLVYFTPKVLQPSLLWKYSDCIAFSDLGGSFDEFKKKFLLAQTLASAEKPILVSSYGTLAESNNHNGYGDTRSLEYQAKFLLDRFRTIEEAYNQAQPIAGGFAYTLCDYHFAIAPLLPNEPQNKYLATFGVVSLKREKKMSFQMLSSLYLGERVTNPPIGSPRREFSPSLILASTFLTTLLVYLINGNRRFQENLQRALVRPVNLYMDIRDQRLYTIFDPLLLLLILSFIWSSILSAFLHSLRLSEDLDFWLSHFIRVPLLKESINYLVLNPHVAVLAFGLTFFILSLLLPLLVKFLIVLVRRTQVSYLQLFHVWVWACAQWVVLVFIAALIDRLENSAFNFVALVLSLILFLLSFGRFLRGISVVAELNRFAVSFTGFLLLSLVLLVLFYLSDTFNHTLAYLQYHYDGLKTFSIQP